MCQITNSETFTRCGHQILCHLKYGLRYCPAPNGVLFTNPEAYQARNFYPTRFCKEETWVCKTKKIKGLCKSCKEKREGEEKEKAMKEAMGKGEGVWEKDEDEDGEEEVEEEEEFDSDADSDSEEDPNVDESPEAAEDRALEELCAGVIKSFAECECILGFYKGGKLQDCFVARDEEQDQECKYRRAYREPTPPTVDKKLFKAHEEAREQEFSMEMRDDLMCVREPYMSRCADCERKRVVEEVKAFEQYMVRGEGFRKRKPMGLWVFPVSDGGMERVVGVRGEV